MLCIANNYAYIFFNGGVGKVNLNRVLEVIQIWYKVGSETGFQNKVGSGCGSGFQHLDGSGSGLNIKF